MDISLSFLCSVQARLKAHWSVGLIRDDITLEKVGGARMVIFGCPRDKFSVAEVTHWARHTNIL